MGWFSSLFSSGGSASNIGNALLSGIGSALGGSSDRGSAPSKEAGRESRRDMLYAAGIEDFYKQRDRSEKRDAFKNFSGWGNLSQTNPGYKNTHTPNAPIPLPVTDGGAKEFDAYIKTLKLGGG